MGMPITLEVTTQGGYHRFTASFSTEEQAVAYIARMASKGNVRESEDHPIDPERFPALEAALYPMCHHMMPAHACMDPDGEHHFGTREQEMAREGY